MVDGASVSMNDPLVEDSLRLHGGSFEPWIRGGFTLFGH